MRLVDILDAWREVSGETRKVGRFKQLVHFRHWLAHGRYGIQKSGIDPDPYEAWQIADDLFRALPGFQHVFAA